MESKSHKHSFDLSYISKLFNVVPLQQGRLTGDLEEGEFYHSGPEAGWTFGLWSLSKHGPLLAPARTIMSPMIMIYFLDAVNNISNIHLLVLIDMGKYISTNMRLAVYEAIERFSRPSDCLLSLSFTSKRR